MAVPTRGFVLFVLYMVVTIHIVPAQEKKVKHVQRSMQPRPLEPVSVKSPIFELLTPEKTGLNFLNLVPGPQSFKNGSTLFSIAAGGVAIGDVNNDGKPDIYLTRFMAPNKLFYNKGNLRFEEAPISAGVNDSIGASFGACMVDIDGDKDLDIYVSKYGFEANKLFINNGDGTFTDKAKEYGLDVTANSIHSTFFDYDNDGDLDMYLIINGIEKIGFVHKGEKSLLFRNNGNSTFTDVTDVSGVINIGFGLSCIATDVNNDGWLDLFTANDFEEPDHLFLNNKNGTFTDVRKKAFRHTSHFSMGSDAADFNNDGFSDIITVDMLPENHYRRNTQFETMSAYSATFDSTQIIKNCLHLNLGDTTFSDISYLSGIAATEWSWSVLFADFDNDGKKDICATNGLTWDVMDRDLTRYGITPEKMLKSGVGKEMLEASQKKYDINMNRNLSTDYSELLRNIPRTQVNNYLFRNKGGLQFEQVSEQWGFTEPFNSCGAAYADLDADGDLDLIINNIDSVATIYKNNSSDNNSSNYLQCKFIGKGANTEGIGAKVTVVINGEKQIAENLRSRGFVSSVDAGVHFGIGESKIIDEVIVQWQSGAIEKIKNVSANQTLVLNEQNAKKEDKAPSESKRLFAKIKSERILNYVHKENVFDDFFQERLLPNRLSINGPGMAVGDVNGDGTDDIYFGGAEGVPGSLFIQNSKGEFAPSEQKVFSDDAGYEQQGCLFFDIDKDGDLDLYVANGGNESCVDQQELLQDVLYINNGKGQFTKGGLPAMLTSTSCVIAGDIDNDGDLDLFVGGRNVPGKFHLRPRSYILLNNKGTLVDVTESVCGIMSKEFGLVRSALFTDYNNDNKVDLIVANEWSSIRFFKNVGGSYVEETENTGVDQYKGWWSSINGGDFDNDGDIDYVLGNAGTNIRYKATDVYPVEVFSRDYDLNGSTDHVMTYRQNDKRFTVRTVNFFYNSMPILRKKYPTFNEFALASFDDMFRKEDVDSSVHVVVNEFRSVLLENKGLGKFAIKPLPALAQSSTVNGIVIDDVNDDGNLDVVLHGNNYGPDVEAWRYDASSGCVLLGNGNNDFTALLPYDAGFSHFGDTRGIVTLRKASDSSVVYFVVGTNKGRPGIFELRHKGGIDWDSGNTTSAPPNLLQLRNGKQRKYERYYGSGYLSQSSSYRSRSPLFKNTSKSDGKKKKL